ncbi:MAG TPA: SPFH domain-containing protein [Rubrobacter sp.]
MMTETLEARFQTQTVARMQEFSRIKEVVSGWSGVRQYLRGGDEGQIVPVVIPKDRRRYGWLFLLGVAIYMLGFALFSGSAALAVLAVLVAVFFLGLALLWLWRGAIVEIEQGTTGVRSRYGRIEGTLSPGRHYLWRPWDRVEFVVDTATEIPYLAPVAVCPTQENVPLKAIEFFLKFRIVDPLAFVRVIGASNFDLVLSSAVQDAIRQRSRQVSTEKAYDLRGSDVGDMQEYLNRQLAHYGVRILGANIPDVQLPDQYQQHLATRERVAKELAAYEREWELTRKQRIDTLLMDIERSKKDRDARLIEVKEARNRARQDVARMLEEQETEAQRVRLEIEDARPRRPNRGGERGHGPPPSRPGPQGQPRRGPLRAGPPQGRGRREAHAARPVLIRGEGGEQSALSTLILARLLPQLTADGSTVENAGEALRDLGDEG